MRLKLYLSFLWMQTDDRGVPLTIPAQAWAELLDLTEPRTAGARRIHEAQRWLEGNSFVGIQAQPGRASRVTVLNETGTGERYVAPGAAAKALKNTPEGAKHLYAQIPATFWTNGHLARLSGTGLALYLVLLDQHGLGGADEPLPVWFSPRIFKERYALSDDTRAKGIKELRDAGLVTVQRRAVNPQDFDIERLRNVYTLQAAAL